MFFGFHLRAEFFKVASSKISSTLRKHFAFFFLNVMRHIFHQNFSFGSNFSLSSVKCGKLAQENIFDLMMFFDAFENDVFELFFFLQFRIKNGFLDMRVDFQFLFYFFENRFVLVFFGGFYLLKKMLNLVVVVLLKVRLRS